MVVSWWIVALLRCVLLYCTGVTTMSFIRLTTECGINCDFCLKNSSFWSIGEG